MDVSEGKRLRAIEEENAKLKRLLADTMLDNSALKDLLGKNGDARCRARCRGSSPDCLWDERAAGVPSPGLLPDGDAPSGASHQRRRAA
jgi:hypothetical protein